MNELRWVMLRGPIGAPSNTPSGDCVVWTHRLLRFVSTVDDPLAQAPTPAGALLGAVNHWEDGRPQEWAVLVHDTITTFATKQEAQAYGAATIELGG